MWANFRRAINPITNFCKIWGTVVNEDSTVDRCFIESHSKFQEMAMVVFIELGRTKVASNYMIQHMKTLVIVGGYEVVTGDTFLVIVGL